ncbi:uncharacterized protein [Dermacentor albipictus]|uniref:uncharacterized protein n=1 Tax=Dermacentor albipictus TaxID=60249 RepID=UPI0038FCFBA3
MVAIVAPLPIVSDDIFPPEGTYSGLLTHGVADIRLSFVVMNERRAFCTQFLTVVLPPYSFTYLYPSPRVLTSNFTVMKIFSVTVWCFWGSSLAVIFFALRAVSLVERRLRQNICVPKVSSLAQFKDMKFFRLNTYWDDKVPVDQEGDQTESRQKEDHLWMLKKTSAIPQLYPELP